MKKDIDRREIRKLKLYEAKEQYPWDRLQKTNCRTPNKHKEYWIQNTRYRLLDTEY